MTANPVQRHHSNAETLVDVDGDRIRSSEKIGDISSDDTLYSLDSEEETSEYSNIWRIYNQEAARADASLTDVSNRGIDVLLVFTGLFSAVLTTFIIQSYQLMVPQAGDLTNQLLSQLISLQANASGAHIEPLSLDLGGATSSEIQWVNGLWFASLSCSLSTALISMLAKHWLQIYVPDISGSPRHRARQRQFRYMQLETWHVLTVINTLPLLLHAALLLFFAGILVLLWSTGLPIALTTFVIIAIAYAFYFASIWVPMIYPSCPYQHPITAHLRRWTSSEISCEVQIRSPGNLVWRDLEKGNREAESGNNNVLQRASYNSGIINSDDILDARALIWLFRRSNDTSVASAALKAIGRLPRDFSCYHILREANAIPLVLQGFQSCFYKDRTADVIWYPADAESAALYCQAWMRLTQGTFVHWWPSEFLAPLKQLQKLKENADVVALATCLQALISSENHIAQWAIISNLENFVDGKIQLTPSTQCWLVDTLLECSVHWEFPAAVIQETTEKAIPVLLRLLNLSTHALASNVRSAAALTLHALSGDKIDLSTYSSDEHRLEAYCSVVLSPLSKIAHDPSHFGVKDNSLLDFVAIELSRLASPVFSEALCFSPASKNAVRSSLSKLYVDGRVGAGLVADEVLADVLQLLFPPTAVSLQQRPLFVRAILQTMTISVHLRLNIWSVRLLEALLTDCTMPTIYAFLDGKGVRALLRTANTTDIDSGRLQADSLRTLCAFIQSGTTLYFRTPSTALSIDLFNPIFQSDFFSVFYHLLDSRSSWLPEFINKWVPALVDLCSICPHEPNWPMVENMLRHFAENNEGEDDYERLLVQIEKIHRFYS